MKRTLAIILSAAMALCLLSACSSGKGEAGVVNVYNWGEYIDEDLLTQFEEETGITVNYKTYESNEQMYSVLKQGGASYDVVIPSDYMISRLIDEDMLAEIDYDQIPNYALIDPALKTADYDPDGLYTVPYTWGTVGLIYNSSVITDELDSWGALFDPAYTGQILMFDNSRDAMGIALKYLGYSMNTTDPDELQAAYELLEEEKPILQGYVMDQIFDKLESGEAAIGPYYAGAYLTMVENNPALTFVIPREGSNQFVDCMCILKDAENVDNAHAFINFMCSTDASLRNAEVVGYTSPNVEVKDLLDLDEESLEIMYPSDETLSRCEAYVNLPQDILALYDELWIALKS